MDIDLGCQEQAHSHGSVQGAHLPPPKKRRNFQFTLSAFLRDKDREKIWKPHTILDLEPLGKAKKFQWREGHKTPTLMCPI